jgi:hypothetical protein
MGAARGTNLQSMIRSIENAEERLVNGVRRLTVRGDGPIRVRFGAGKAFALDDHETGRFVLPVGTQTPHVGGNTGAWVIPDSVSTEESAWMIRPLGPGRITVDAGETVEATCRATGCELVPHPCRPPCGCTGGRFHFDFPGGDAYAGVLAAFYWDTILPCVVERTRAVSFPDPDGYVLSTLAPDSYPGTYPDVDHEFQIKGRLAMGNRVDDDICRRMIELQLRLMREDPEGLWRNPCSVQPDGRREYHVRRGSRSGEANAVMFLVTGNVEVLEAAWLYVAATKDLDWLAERITDLEGAASLIEDWTDRYGRLWSDVYFEDSVVQDGRVCDAQAFAAHALHLLSDLETLADRPQRQAHYARMGRRLADTLVQPLPRGYWDADRERFANWVDRHGEVHDHVHLLSNVLPLVFGYASDEQRTAVLGLVDEHQNEFQRFPSFVAARIGDYTDDEISSPYDLCATGRVWCWDAAFHAWRRDGARLRRQLDQVVAQAARQGFVMGERYDMDHVFYVDGIDWHGAAHYYEYPCVYAWVLVHEYMGIQPSIAADLRIDPRLDQPGRVALESDRWAVAYTFEDDAFVLENLAARPRTMDIDLRALYPGAGGFLVGHESDSRPRDDRLLLAVEPGSRKIIRPTAGATS